MTLLWKYIEDHEHLLQGEYLVLLVVVVVLITYIIHRFHKNLHKEVIEAYKETIVAKDIQTNAYKVTIKALQKGISTTQEELNSLYKEKELLQRQMKTFENKSDEKLVILNLKLINTKTNYMKLRRLLLIALLNGYRQRSISQTTTAVLIAYKALGIHVPDEIAPRKIIDYFDKHDLQIKNNANEIKELNYKLDSLDIESEVFDISKDLELITLSESDTELDRDVDFVFKQVHTVFEHLKTIENGLGN